MRAGQTSGQAAVEDADLPRWLQSPAQVDDVPSPEFMQRKEKLVSAARRTKTVMQEEEQVEEQVEGFSPTSGVQA